MPGIYTYSTVTYMKRFLNVYYISGIYTYSTVTFVKRFLMYTIYQGYTHIVR